MKALGDSQDRNGGEREDEIAEIVGAWRRDRDRGIASSSRDVVARHPELAEELKDAFALLRGLDAAAPVLAGADASAATSADPPTEVRVPPRERLGDFRILREIGRGGMGVVYEAEQVSMRRPVALKVLYPSVTNGAKAIARFQREAHATGRLQHTNIVQVHALGEDAGQWYYAMELVRGRALSEILADLRRLRGGAAPDDRTPSDTQALSTSGGRRAEYARLAGMFVGLAEALATAHEGGVVHRDVKPSNVMLDESGRLKILDFGLAAIQQEAGNVTATGDVLGTPAYMSPEQARGRPATALSDVYALGATFYEVLTLKPPVKGRDFADTVRRVLTVEPVAPRRLERNIPRDLETIVLKALEKEPARRYASAADLAHDLRAFSDDHAIAARRVGPLGRAWRQARRHPARTLLALVALVGVALAVGFAWRASDAESGLRAEEALRRDREYRDLLSRALVEPREASDGTRPQRNLFAEAIALAPQRYEAYFLRAIHLRRPEGVANLADLDAARARGLGERHYHLARALVLQESGHPVETAVEEESSAAPGALDLEGTTLLAALAAARRQDVDAERLFDDVLKSASRGSHVLLRGYVGRSEVRVRRGNFTGAIEDLMASRALISPDAFLPQTDVKIAWLWRRLDRDAEAERQIEQALARCELQPRAWAYAELCWQAYRVGEVGWARRAIDAGLRRWPLDARLRGERLRWLPAAERIVEADRLLAALPESGAGLAADRRQAILLKSVALDEQGNLEAALATTEELAREADATSGVRSHRGYLFSKLGRFGEADVEYRKALTTLPWAEDAVVGYGSHLLYTRRLNEALELLEAAVKGDRSQFMVLDVLALGRQLAGDTEGAAAAAREALTLARDGSASGDDLLSRFPHRSLVALVASHPAEIVDQLESLYKRSPHEELFRECLARAYLGLGRAAEGLAVLDREPALATWRLTVTRAWILLALRRYQDLAGIADRAIEMRPEEPEGYWLRMMSLVGAGSIEGMLPLAQRFVEAVHAQRAGKDTSAGRDRSLGGGARITDAYLSAAHYWIGVVHSRQGNAAQAILEFDTALALGPFDVDERVEILRERASALLRLRRVADAEQVMQEAARLSPDDPSVALYRSNVRAALGDFEGREHCLREAIRLSAAECTPVDWHLEHAGALLGLGRMGEAAAAADAHISSGGQAALAWASLARSLDPRADEAQRQRARELAEKAVASPDAAWQAWRAKGAVHVAAREWSEAVVALKESIAKRPPGPDFLTSILLLRAEHALGTVRDPAPALAALRQDPDWLSEASPLYLRLADELAQASRGWRAQRRPGPLLPDSVSPEAPPPR